MVAAGDNEIVQVLDVKEGKSSKSVPSKKYGVHLARFTHHSRQVLHASTKVVVMFEIQKKKKKKKGKGTHDLMGT